MLPQGSAQGAAQPPLPERAAAPPPAPHAAPPPALPEKKPPPPPLTPEAAYYADLNRLLAPLIVMAPAPEDLKNVAEATRAVAAHDLIRFRLARDQIKDDAAQRLTDWYRLRSGYGEAAEYRAFLDAHPDWPNRSLMRRRMEERLFTSGGTPAEIRAYFKDGSPETGPGYAALASAALAEGQQAEAHKLAAKAWREFDMPATLETGFLERFGALLTPADHKWRLDDILIDEIRWKRSRNERAAFARRLIPLLPEAARPAAEARLAVFLKTPNAAQLMAKLPADPDDPAKIDWGLVYHRIQMLRRADKWADAFALMKKAPTEVEKIVSPDDWWEERRILAMEAIRQNNAKLAYDLVRYAGPLSVNPLKEQAFTAGWIALRHLASPKTAIVHFTTMREAADGPLSRAKSQYWLGRAHTRLGDAAAARQSYEGATREFDTFHGQLARQILKPGPQSLPVGPPATPTAEEVKRFTTSDAVRATVIAQKAGLSGIITRTFMANLRRIAPSEAGFAMGAHLAEALGDTQMSLRIGKSAIAQGKNLAYYAYPVHPFPAYTPLRPPPESAILLAIARQESEFNPTIVSGAGARGLLQVMPITARHVCRDYKIKCDISKLNSDKPYNAKLASAYIADRMAEFSGSYVLTLSGYNAGPGRTRQWIRQLGDPRDANVDPLDWIERIPFQETREYVAKVLSNIQVYRARLGEGEKALRLTDDLARARRLPARAATGN